MNKIKCWFGFHNWFNPIPSERICIRCGKHQARVCYYGQPFIFWLNKKKDEQTICKL